MRIVLLAVMLAASLLASARDESLSDLQARAESARTEDKAPIYIEIAHFQLRDADKLYNDGNVEQARKDVEDVVAFSRQASDAAIKSKKHMKDTEIAARKMAEKLRDIKRTLNLEDQPPLDAAIKLLEDIRTELLAAMFRKEKK